MFSPISTELPLASFTDWVLHLSAFNLQPQGSVLFKCRCLHAVNALILSHGDGARSTEGRLNCRLAHHGVPYLVPEVTRNIPIELPGHLLCFTEDESQTLGHIDFRESDPQHVSKIIRDLFHRRFQVVPDSIQTSVTAWLSRHGKWFG